MPGRAAACVARDGALPVPERGGWTLDSLVKGVLEGDRRAIARSISLVENRDSRARELVSILYPRAGTAFRVGITGPPGVGKSTLVSALVEICRSEDLSVGVISVDPSSPFSEAAVLGDRTRLSKHFLDPQVFIRSMATRGYLGGLAGATWEAALILEAAGTDVVFLETVGVGQSEVEISFLADAVVLVLMPGSGDSVQALKAGVMEIPHLIAVNKKDHPAARAMVSEIESMLSLTGPDRAPGLRVVETQATTGEGAAELWSLLLECRNLLQTSRGGAEACTKNLRGQILALAACRLKEMLVSEPHLGEPLQGILAQVQARTMDPLTAAEALVSEFLRRRQGLAE